MPTDSCLVGIENDRFAMMTSVLHRAGRGLVVRLAEPNVTQIGHMHPALVILDVDRLRTDAFEKIRQLRFVLPDCTIGLYTNRTEEAWGAECHRAGADCILSKRSTESELIAGIGAAVASGCYTDPRAVTTVAVPGI